MRDAVHLAVVEPTATRPTDEIRTLGTSVQEAAATSHSGHLDLPRRPYPS